ncbi:hypothetical protein [Coxiella-like endosymbiont]
MDFYADWCISCKPNRWTNSPLQIQECKKRYNLSVCCAQMSRTTI